ncbi:PREDICTED: COMM domain-containing protein 5-like [Amphimedon queenslandica]|uniref:COMM domain-containing protein 5 n=1 Tax=Amphimedon queenslandica TaxID=400682 RepID=A0A1X7THN1_AMPQE|nr:PREDICTED: COMM domain-containing protein 5-like [Amphimedon queenslandica]|eukprot:XP_003390541.1 PREDICTED: COMM domain-containing protein 5-like [Amphimedon queenslandica]
MSFVQVRPSSGGGSGSLAAERTPFYGARVPDEVKLMFKAMKGSDAATVKNILKFVSQSLEASSSTVDSSLSESFLSLSTPKSTEETNRIVYSGLALLVKLAIRHPNLKQENFKDDLAQIKIPAEVITDISSLVFGKRSQRIKDSLKEKMVRFPQLESLKWRVDVTISNSSLNRVLEPSVLMEMKLSNGNIKTFEVSASRFHELRYSVAFVLKEMEEMEKRNIIKRD